MLQPQYKTMNQSETIWTTSLKLNYGYEEVMAF